MEIKFTKKFFKNLENILQENKNLWVKIEKIIENFEKKWLEIENFQTYDLKKINLTFFRLKIIPFRIILKQDWNLLYFYDIFKRKWKSDYKKY